MYVSYIMGTRKTTRVYKTINLPWKFQIKFNVTLINRKG